MIAMLIGCGLRRGELLALCVESIQLREEQWSSPTSWARPDTSVPFWVKLAIDEWKEAAHIAEGVLFRSINKTRRVWERA